MIETTTRAIAAWLRNATDDAETPRELLAAIRAKFPDATPPEIDAALLLVMQEIRCGGGH